MHFCTSIKSLSAGYSASTKQSEGEEEEEVDEEINLRKDYHVEEVVRLLRAISLHHNPSTMANFLQETVLEKYALYFL